MEVVAKRIAGLCDFEAHLSDEVGVAASVPNREEEAVKTASINLNVNENTIIIGGIVHRHAMFASLFTSDQA